MPANTESGIAFVLVQHLAPDHKSLLVDLVKRYTRMDVFEAVDGMRVQPNCAYIVPPNRDIGLTDSTLRVTEPVEPRGLRLPIDYLFRSLAASHHERAIAQSRAKVEWRWRSRPTVPTMTACRAARSRPA